MAHLIVHSQLNITSVISGTNPKQTCPSSMKSRILERTKKDKKKLVGARDIEIRDPFDNP